MSIRRDYKSTANGQRHRRAVRWHGLLVLTLALVGLFGGLLAYIKGDHQPQQAPATAATATPSATGNTATASGAKHSPEKPSAAQTPETASSALAPSKPKYDFYTELPKRQVDIHPEGAATKTAPRPALSKPQPGAELPRKPAAPGIITPAVKSKTAVMAAAAPRSAPSATATPHPRKRSTAAGNSAAPAPAQPTATRTAKPSAAPAQPTATRTTKPSAAPAQAAATRTTKPSAAPAPAQPTATHTAKPVRSPASGQAIVVKTD